MMVVLLTINETGWDGQAELVHTHIVKQTSVLRHSKSLNKVMSSAATTNLSARHTTLTPSLAVITVSNYNVNSTLRVMRPKSLHLRPLQLDQRYSTI